MPGRIFLFLILYAFCFESVIAQTTFYSKNGATNPADVNSWTQDPTGVALLLPPANFSNPNDIFVIDGEFSLFTVNWTVAGTVQVRSGIIVRDNNFYTKKLEVVSGVSYFSYNLSSTVDTLIVGLNGQLTTSNGIVINKYLLVKGKLYILTNPITGAGNIVLEEGATLQIINNKLEPPGYGGIIGLTGARMLSTKANYEFGFNVGTYTTGKGLPDTVKNLRIELGDNTIGKITSSSVVTGNVICSGFSGGSAVNGKVILSGATLTCLGSILTSNSNSFEGDNNARVIFAGTAADTDTASTLPECTIPSLVLNGTKKLYLKGNVTLTDSLILEKGLLYTGGYSLQVGSSNEGGIRRTGGHIVGSLSRLKISNTATSLFFPVGSNDYYRPFKLTYTTAPASSGLITVTHSDGIGYSPLSPSLSDDGFSLDKISKMFWQVNTLLLSGGVYTIGLVPVDGNGLITQSNLHVITSDVGGANLSLSGKHYFDSAGTAQRTEISSPLGNKRYYIGNGPIRQSGNIVFSIDSILFGDVAKDTVKYLTISVGNIGSDTLHLDSIKTHSASFVLDSVPAKILPHAGSAIRVKFQPADFGIFTDSISIVKNGLVVVIPLSGSSRMPKLTASLHTIVVGPVAVTDTAVSKLTVYNKSSANKLTVTNISKNTPVFWIDRSIPFTVRGNDSATIDIKFNINSFTPNGYGTWFDTLEILSDGGSDKIALKGLSPNPAIAVVPRPLNFGSVKKDTIKQLVFGIVDSSVNVLRIDSLWTKTTYFDVVHTLAYWYVKQGDTTKVSIRFTPDAVGVYNDTLYIANNSLVSPYKVPLIGNGSLTGVQFSETAIPEEYSLSQNYPNPFNPSTIIRYGLPTASFVSIKIYTAIGQQVASLINTTQASGLYEKEWHALTASGLYFYRIDAVSTSDPNKRFSHLKKMILLK